MPRPLRIQFENAQYHVMNRGAGKKNIFGNDNHRHYFLELLSEAHKLFGIEIHAYCLMNNHYHLLIQTPFPNLSRAMQYINGLYTQYYNKESNIDGALFRGRYRAILVSYDEYFLNVSRYIHLNPIDAKITNDPVKFPWSSYRYFMAPDKKPDWLNIENTLNYFSSANSIEEYKSFVTLGNDLETYNFYNKKNTAVIFSSNEFKKNILQDIHDKKRFDSSADYNRTNLKYTQNKILGVCAKLLNIPENNMQNKISGKPNMPRKIAIYSCRMWSGEKIKNIAKFFSCRSSNNISDVVREIKILIKQDLYLKHVIDTIYLELYNHK